ncbi:winged helix-turn-helix transcriptional regulator [Roseospira marina]|uniref:Winged helix-turn-helix transcriptional regulator n=1 Tax=Roseospira marina TaxID=140057 RepID=A0A5M6ID97_9PROT|nr:Lrp/AsnC ligand binding domain-containing protein [Roseospira marina]KAA5606251.1 winged helix-turn-helix transcriptional regulator [Roseospira marina]MBB4314406.1 Lrp/AsnC family leucine-responsive transcriptional regulator [Roseospira marina]MBB5087566.1 Lrp/AsnC family leucine-responsive transcriptional regulator [Roseospira marina]
MTRTLDRIDRRILAELQADARLTLVDVARRVGLSKTPCLDRVRRLAETGYITGYTAVLDPDRLGVGHLAFVQVTLGATTSEALATFNRAVTAIPEIQGCYMIAGGFDYLLKVRTADVRAFRVLLGDRIATLPHLVQTSSFVVMETVKDSLTVPIEDVFTDRP